MINVLKMQYVLNIPKNQGFALFGEEKCANDVPFSFLKMRRRAFALKFQY